MQEILSDAAREKRAEYLRRWRDSNREKVKSYSRKYWEKKAQQEADNGKD